jgi:hypothetical protein
VIARGRNVPTANTAAALQFRVRVLFGPVGREVVKVTVYRPR